MKTIAKENFPTRQSIKRRFLRRLAGMSDLFDPIAELLAEEAERYLNELWLRGAQPPVSFLKTKAGERRIVFQCPSCEGKEIQPGYSYCPKCGVKVVFQRRNL
jgi:hypothetical protein